MDAIAASDNMTFGHIRFWIEASNNGTLLQNGLKIIVHCNSIVKDNPVPEFECKFRLAIRGERTFGTGYWNFKKGIWRYPSQKYITWEGLRPGSYLFLGDKNLTLDFILSKH